MTDAVLADQEFVGYYRTDTTGLATASTYGPLTLADIRARATTKYALIHISGFWCGVCKGALKKLVQVYPGYASRALFIDILGEGATPSDESTKDQLDSWVSNLKIPYVAIRDPDGVSFAAVNQIGRRTTFVIVELQTMKILYTLDNGPDPALAKLDSLE